MKNLIKAICFILFIGLLIKLYFHITIIDMNRFYNVSYGRGLELKFEKLKAIETKKIVIAGGSNVNFGVDSDLIETQIGMPVVNMALHASFKTYTVIQPIIPYLKKGDVLIISCEYGQTLYGSSMEVANYFYYIPLKGQLQVYKNLDAIGPVLKEYVKISQKNILEYKFEDQYLETQGDGPYAYNAYRNDNLLDSKISGAMPDDMYNGFGMTKLDLNTDEEFLDYFKNLKTSLSKKGVKVYFALPAAAKSTFKEEEVVAYYKDLSYKTNIELLSERANLFPQDSLLNTQYHLNNKGRKGRTINLSKDLATKLNIPLKTPKEQFFLKQQQTNDTLRTTGFEYNNLFHGELTDQTIVFKRLGMHDLALNHFRIKEPGDFFNKKKFKLILKAKPEVVDDLFFITVRGPEEWDEKYLDEDNNYVLIKNTITYAFYQDGYSYVGFYFKNLNDHLGESVTIISTEIYDPFVVMQKGNFEIKENFEYELFPSESDININQLIEQLKNKDFILQKNKKYIMSLKKGTLFIKDLYSGKTHRFDNLNNSKIVMSATNKKLEINSYD